MADAAGDAGPSARQGASARGTSAAAGAPIVSGGHAEGTGIDIDVGAGAGVQAVRRRLVEAFARRAAAHAGTTRGVLDERLAQLRAGLRADPEPAPGLRGQSTELAPRGPLAELVARVARPGQGASAPVVAQAAAPAGAATPARARPGHATPVSALPAPATPPELESLPYFRRTWSRLSLEQRLAQSRAALPDNAGPLNSHHLVHRALLAMRELAPSYLEHFMAHADALLWLELANEAAVADAPPLARAEGERKTGRGRPA